MELTIRYRMVVRKPRPGPLTPGDWARAALAAIARGVLGYLHQNLNLLETTVEHDTESGHKHNLDFDLAE